MICRWTLRLKRCQNLMMKMTVDGDQSRSAKNVSSDHSKITMRKISRYGRYSCTRYICTTLKKSHPIIPYQQWCAKYMRRICRHGNIIWSSEILMVTHWQKDKEESPSSNSVKLDIWFDDVSRSRCCCCCRSIVWNKKMPMMKAPTRKIVGNNQLAISTMVEWGICALRPRVFNHVASWYFQTRAFSMLRDTQWQMSGIFLGLFRVKWQPILMPRTCSEYSEITQGSFNQGYQIQNTSPKVTIESANT